eukprot:4417826-Pyramimonas_sp.AAC.1
MPTRRSRRDPGRRSPLRAPPAVSLSSRPRADLAQLDRRRCLADLDRSLRYGGVSLPKPRSPQ